jgi:hypothetical protein
MVTAPRRLASAGPVIAVRSAKRSDGLALASTAIEKVNDDISATNQIGICWHVLDSLMILAIVWIW